MCKYLKLILFLDIDGVLLPYYKNGGRLIAFDSTLEKFPMSCVKALNKIITETDCDIVISSDWRHHFTLDQLKIIFEINGILKFPIGVTGNIKTTATNLENSRNEEIHNWVNENKPDAWCAIDDMNLEAFGLENFVHCKRAGKEGISQSGIAEKVIKKLKSV